VEGIELFFIGPADYSSTSGHRGLWEGPGVAAELLAIKDAIRACGKHCGILATSPENAVERREQGFRAIGLGSDAGLFLRGLRSLLGAVGLDRRILPDFIPDRTVMPAAPSPATSGIPPARPA
jgi:2-keto-3-deoxy-L-rhamnonate aldolase RhmA